MASNPMAQQQSTLQPSSSRHRHHHYHRSQHITKKRTIAFSETQTHILTRKRHSETSHSSHRNHKRRRESRFSHRQWTHSTHDAAKFNGKVVLVSYNVLGVANSVKHPKLYRRVSSKHMDWVYRKKRLCKEINGYRSSILCFQEVDKFDDLNALLGKDGFKGVHKARTGEAVDGCAIFWKNEQFTLLHEESIDFQIFGLHNNVAQFCVFKMKQDKMSGHATARPSGPLSPRRFVVGNIHVLYNPKRGDIKLGQMRLFLAKAYELSREWGDIPVVIAGDLNSLPQSAMYQFLASSELHLQLHDRREISGQMSLVHNPRVYKSFSWTSMHGWTNEELRLATGSGLDLLRHNLQLYSAYAGVPGSSKTRDAVGEPLATSYHSMFMGTVDYIWHTPDLVPVRVLETLPMDILRKTGGLPSKEWGSDHLALVCELAFVDDDNEV